MNKGSNGLQIYLATKTFFFIKHLAESVSWGTYVKKRWSRIKALIFASYLHWAPKSKNLPLIHDIIFKGGNKLTGYYSGGRDFSDEKMKKSVT